MTDSLIFVEGMLGFFGSPIFAIMVFLLLGVIAAYIFKNKQLGTPTKLIIGTVALTYIVVELYGVSILAGLGEGTTALGYLIILPIQFAIAFIGYKIGTPRISKKK